MAKTTDKPTKNSTDSHTHSNPQTHPEIGENEQLQFSLKWQSIQTAYQKAVRKYQPHIKTDGFRKGKAPLSVVEQMVGQDRLYQEVAQQLVPKAYSESIKVSQLKPITDPEIHVEKMNPNEDWIFHAHIAQKPSIKLGKYQAIVAKAMTNFVKEQKDAKKSEETKQALTPEQLNDRKVEDALGALRAQIKPVIPELLVRQEATRQLQQLEKYLKVYQIEPESYFKSVGKSLEQIQQEYAAQALGRWQIELIIDAIADDQKISISEDEIKKSIQSDTETNTKSISEADTQYARSLLRKKKVIEYLLSLSP